MVDKSDMYYGETSEAGKVRQLHRLWQIGIEIFI